MKKVVQNPKIVCFLALCLFLTISCEKQIQQDDPFSTEIFSEIGPTLKTNECCEVYLLAGQTIIIGSVKTEFISSSEVLITYIITDPGWCLLETHLDVQIDSDNFPMTKKGNPKVGHFGYGQDLDCDQYWEQIVDLNDIEDWEEGMTIYIAAHGEVSNGEGAWGEGESFPGKNWAMYFECIPPSVWECGDPITDERDGQDYNTVLIGDQCWMAENLNIGTMIDGSQNMTNNQVIEKFCYNNDPSNCLTYGGLYQWDEMLQYVTSQGAQGICPSGWHIPTDDEWDELTDYLGGSGVAGGKMKESSSAHWNSPNTGATNSSGFAALPGGYRAASTSLFYDLGRNGYFWSSTEDDASYSWFRILGDNYENVYRDRYYKTNGFSVRCVQD